MELCEAQRGPLFPVRELRRLILPLVAEQTLSVAIGLADVLMMSSLGEAAVSGVALVNEINNLMIQILAALATGGAVVVAQYLGNRRDGEARVAAGQLMWVVGAVSLLLTAVSLAFTGDILRLIYGELDPEVFRLSYTYFSITALTYPFLGLYNAAAALFRSTGNSKVSMTTALVMNVVHIGGNAILIYVFHLGVEGAAISSVFARALSALVILNLLRNRHNAVWLDFRARPSFKPEMAKRILFIGVPNGLENSMFQIGRLITQSVVAGIGTVAVAANAAAGSIMNIVNIPGTAIGLALITVVGQCMGAGEQDQAAANVKRLMVYSIAANTALGLLFLVFATPALKLFGLEPATTRMAIALIPAYVVMTAVAWSPAFTLPNALRATGDVRFTMAVSMVSMWTLRIGLSHLFAGPMGLGLAGVWYAMYADWVARAIIFFFRWRSGKWRRMRVI